MKLANVACRVASYAFTKTNVVPGNVPETAADVLAKATQDWLDADKKHKEMLKDKTKGKKVAEWNGPACILFLVLSATLLLHGCAHIVALPDGGQSIYVESEGITTMTNVDKNGQAFLVRVQGPENLFNPNNRYYVFVDKSASASWIVVQSIRPEEK